MTGQWMKNPVLALTNGGDRDGNTTKPPKSRRNSGTDWKARRNSSQSPTRGSSRSLVPSYRSHDGRRASTSTSTSYDSHSRVSESRLIPRPPDSRRDSRDHWDSRDPHPQFSTDLAGVPEELYDADPRKWRFQKMRFHGDFQADAFGRRQVIKGKDIRKAVEHFKKNPGKYVAMTYQTSMLNWPEERHKFTFIHRIGTKRLVVQGIDPDGWMTVLKYTYQALPPFRDDDFPYHARDDYTDEMFYRGERLHSRRNKPILPGRGMGICDAPNIKIIGDVDPSDINQGNVGDCWLLSGISSLAEFDGAIKHLFRKTRDLELRPFQKPNMYTVTLWDLETWTEVDIEIDERLAVYADGTGKLLGAKPSIDGELWVCYLEKAVAVHCGGWDKIVGGVCTHAWALLTGCREQYTIMINEKTGKYACYAKYNERKKKWEKHSNSYQDDNGKVWRVSWPEVGGGGGLKHECGEEEMFQKLCAWDDENYIIGAAVNCTRGKDEGLVDDHAYSVIECINDVAGTNIDMIKVRNPWGKGEIEDGMFDDDGPGWDEYPQIRELLNPTVADDGMFWVTKEEFFDFFGTLYLSASNMSHFLED